MQEFFAMGGYAGYVWTAYAVALVILVINGVTPRRWERKLLAELASRQGTSPS